MPFSGEKDLSRQLHLPLMFKISFQPTLKFSRSTMKDVRLSKNKLLAAQMGRWLTFPQPNPSTPSVSLLHPRPSRADLRRTWVNIDHLLPEILLEILLCKHRLQVRNHYLPITSECMNEIIHPSLPSYEKQRTDSDHEAKRLMSQTEANEKPFMPCREGLIVARCLRKNLVCDLHLVMVIIEAKLLTLLFGQSGRKR